MKVRSVSPEIHRRRVLPIGADSAAVRPLWVTDERGLAVSEREEEEQCDFVFSEIVNSAKILGICRKIIIAPKILKSFVLFLYML